MLNPTIFPFKLIPFSGAAMSLIVKNGMAYESTCLSVKPITNSVIF